MFEQEEPVVYIKKEGSAGPTKLPPKTQALAAVAGGKTREFFAAIYDAFKVGPTTLPRWVLSGAYSSSFLAPLPPG